eukprot:TRINITY_DN1590_c0_g1_i1.p1 TRINITY_DN1590_c0_g1~~TRINITY_DN1590_c0_g1_i1.p1  ORF type:complete len:255 (+),score=44.23 TRINITY_DN1590_c0_g1_i1:50-814(+)
MAKPVFCRTCNGPVSPGEKFLNALGGSFHERCFKCNKCGTNLGTLPFYVIDNNPFCKDCQSSHNMPNCTACNQIIKRSDEFLEYKGQKYHETCFTCKKCKTPLNYAQFYVKSDGRYCAPCLGQGNSVVTSQVTVETSTESNYPAKQQEESINIEQNTLSAPPDNTSPKETSQPVDSVQKETSQTVWKEASQPVDSVQKETSQPVASPSKEEHDSLVQDTEEQLNELLEADDEILNDASESDLEDLLAALENFKS